MSEITLTVQADEVVTVYFVGPVVKCTRVRLHGLMGLLDEGPEVVECEPILLPKERYSAKTKDNKPEATERAIRAVGLACDCGD